MTRTKVEYPQKGKIVKTGAEVTVLGKRHVAGIAVYVVRFPDGLETEWAAGMVRLLGPWDD